MAESKPVYLNDKEKWLETEEYKDIFFYWCQIWLHAYVNDLESSCGKNFKKTLCVFHGTDAVWYLGEKDSKEFEEHLVNKIEESPEFGRSINKNIYKYSDKLHEFAVSLSKKELSKLPDKEIASLIAEEFKIHTELYSWGALPNVSDMFHSTFTNYLKKMLEGHAGSEEETNSYMNILSTPTKNSIVTEQKLEFIELIKNIQDSNPGIKSVFEKSLDSKNLNAIKEYQKKYHHTKHLWLGKEGTYSLAEYISQVNEFLAKNESAANEIQRIKADLAAKIEVKRKLEERLKLGGKLKEIFDVYSEFMLTKAYRREAQIKWAYEFTKLLVEISKRLDLTLGQTYYMLTEEIESALLEGKIDRETIKEREKMCVYYGEKGFKKVYIGKEALELSKMTASKADENITEIRGQCANLGLVRGTVKVVNTISDIKKVNKGDVLVAITTNPDLLPAMEKASAVVTEQGGITSHAAIVARELNIPCVIGTKIAAKVLKDGDFVEVDANRGIVRILERA